ncbi:MAG: PAS domain-containing protein, partial [Terracidiphilus sp.]
MGSKAGAIEGAGLAEAVAQAADAIVITDSDGVIQFVNPAFTTLTGYSGEEAVGQSPRVLKSGCQSDSFYRELWSTIRSGKVWRGELVNRRKDGSTYLEEMRIAPLMGPEGKTRGYLAVKR